MTIRQADLHHGSDDTPYEGFDVRGWPVRTLLGGRTFMHDGEIGAEKLGKYLARSCRPWLRRRSVEHETGRACRVMRSLSTLACDARGLANDYMGVVIAFREQGAIVSNSDRPQARLKRTIECCARRPGRDSGCEPKSFACAMRWKGRWFPVEAGFRDNEFLPPTGTEIRNRRALQGCGGSAMWRNLVPKAGTKADVPPSVTRLGPGAVSAGARGIVHPREVCRAPGTDPRPYCRVLRQRKHMDPARIFAFTARREKGRYP